MLTRSEQMSRVRSRNNRSTELRLIAFFKRRKITGWRRSHRLYGKPDFVFPRLRLAVFVDGCFWHGCPKHGRTPKSNLSFWVPKLAANRKRDRIVNSQLKRTGWRVVRIWEHELRNHNVARLARKLSALRFSVSLAPGDKSTRSTA
jgi:DNA mismatch endonuclease (patch repair protein)